MPRWGSRNAIAHPLRFHSWLGSLVLTQLRIGKERMRVQPGRPIVPLQNGRRRLETPGPKDGCGGPCSQRRPYHRKWALRLDDPKRQRMVETSSLRDDAKIHPPQALEKRREFDLPEVSFVVDIKYLIRGGERWIRTRGISRRIAYRAVHRDFGPGEGSAFAMRCPRCGAFTHCRTPRLDPSPPLVANAEFSPQPREVVGAHRILGTLLR